MVAWCSVTCGDREDLYGGHPKDFILGLITFCDGSVLVQGWDFFHERIMPVLVAMPPVAPGHVELFLEAAGEADDFIIMAGKKVIAKVVHLSSWLRFRPFYYQQMDLGALIRAYTYANRAGLSV